MVKQENEVTAMSKKEASLLKKLNDAQHKHQVGVAALEKARKDLDIKRTNATRAQEEAKMKTTRAVQSDKAKEQHTVRIFFVIILVHASYRSLPGFTRKEDRRVAS